MDFLEPSSYAHFPHHHEQLHDQLSTSMPTYAESQAMHNFAMAHQSAAPMMSLPNPATKTNETKPRLGKDEVDVLEREFKKNQKPTTQTKRSFAENMGVDLARINNWFQNRRAKRKQEKKQEAFKAGQAQEVLGYSEPSSPDLYHGTSFFGDNIIPLQHSATFPLINGPPAPVAPCNPQYPDPSSASMESLHRTLAAAQAGHNAAARQDFHGNFLDQSDALNFGGPLHDSSSTDRAHFPTPEESVSPFDTTRNYSYSSLSNVYRPESIPEVQHSPEEVCDNTPTPYAPSTIPQLMTTFPSQLLPQSHDGRSSQYNDASSSHSPEDSNESTCGIGFKYEIQESEESSNIPPPPSSLPFRSPPPPMDIASRRKKVHVKPAALMADTIRGRPQMGPRTVSHAPDGFRRPSDSPMSSPMRRIVSAGGNRNGMSGRIQKPSLESAQRSPINFGGFSDATAFLERNQQNIRNAPNLTAGTSLNSNLAPPTPMSPREREMTLKREGSSSSESPVEGGMNYVYNAGGFTTMEGNQSWQSPPETPQNALGLNNPNTNNGWPSSSDFQDTWYDVPDEPIYTPAQAVFPMELQMPPAYLSSLSQPVTPAFGQFPPSFMLNNESPQLEHEQPMYTLANQPSIEYTFPDSQSNFSIGMYPSPMNKHKTFQFSNSTPADFTEK